MKHNITGIMACTDNGIIGCNNTIPWCYPEEFKHFQDTTYGHIMIMGRKTFDTISKSNLFSNRSAIIFTRDTAPTKSSLINTNVSKIFINSMEEFNNIPLQDNKKLYMIGGAEIATLFLTNNLINEFILTKINREYSGDTYFPLSLLRSWDRNTKSSCKDYDIIHYTTKISKN